MSIAQRIGQVAAQLETAKASAEFGQLAKCILQNRTMSNAAAAAERSSREVGSARLADIIKAGSGGISRAALREKAVVSAHGLTGSVFADYSNIANGFVNSLVNAGAFDAMLSSMTPIPLQTASVGSISVSATAYSLAENSAKPISRVTVTGQQVTPQKAHAILVTTDELSRASGANAVALISQELRNAVAMVTDQQFFTTILTGITAGTSSGVTAESVRADISGLLRSVTTGQNSKLFLVVTPLIAKMWSMLSSGAKGDSAFPQLGPLGGSINSIPVLISDGLAAGQVALVDASGIAAASGDISLNTMQEGTVVLNDAPDSPPSAATPYLSLWQMNQSAVVCERFFVAARLRSDACATLTNANSYQGGNSPP